MTKNVLKDQEGMVLILVLIVLVAAIIMGVMIIKSSALESRMAGNERRYIQNFANLETAVSLAMIQSTAALATVATTSGKTYDYASGSMPAGTNVSIRLDRIGKPPKGSGNDPGQRARFYVINATEDEDNQTITVGAYKVFPPQQ